MKVARNLAGPVALACILLMTFCCDAQRQSSSSTTAAAEPPVITAQRSADLNSRQISELIDSFRSTASSHVIRPGGPPTGATVASETLLRNLDRTAPALLVALTASDNDIRRHAAYTLGASKRREFAAPLKRAIATELTSYIRQRYTPSGIPDDHYFASLRAMVLALARTGGVQSLKDLLSSSPRDHLAVRALDDSLKRTVDRSPCGAAENSQSACLDEWRRVLIALEASNQFPIGEEQ